MKVETYDYGAGPRLELYFMMGSAQVLTVAQAVELRNLLDEQIREIQLRNAPVHRGASIELQEVLRICEKALQEVWDACHQPLWPHVGEAIEAIAAYQSNNSSCPPNGR